MKHVCYIIGLISMFSNSHAQSSYKKSEYKKRPVWIDMMNDTSANYFETIKAFKAYYKDRALPKEAMENPDGDSFERDLGLINDEGEEKEREEKERMQKHRKPEPEVSHASEVRAFKGWFYSIKPWVRSDGSIVGPQEQQAIINQQQQELKQIEKSNR